MNTSLNYSKSDTTEHCIEVCNRLLRGERSAVETYDKAIKKYGDEPILQDLRRIRQEHLEAVTILDDNVRSMGGEPDTSSGAWGTFANVVQGAANLFGADSALTALQSGEEAGKADYEGALEDRAVMTGCKELIRTHLLPQCTEHLATLKRLQDAA